MIPSKATLRHWARSRETPVAVQIAKFGLCGVASLVTFVLALGLLAWCFHDFVNSASLTPGQRALHLNILHLGAFIPANTVAYLSNRAFVFTPGRHRAHHEAALFFGVALISFFAGLFAPEFLIRTFNTPNALASFGFVLTSGLVNFVSRKFLVFAR